MSSNSSINGLNGATAGSSGYKPYTLGGNAPIYPQYPNNYASPATAPKYPSLTPYKQMLPPITNSKRLRRKQRLFHKDIENLLYALGDRPVSTDATVLCLEEILVDYLVDLSSKILTFAKSQGRSRIKMNDLAFALRNDPLKLARFQYIIEQNHRIERAKKLFEDKTGNFEGGPAAARNLDDSDDDEEEQEDTKKKKRKVTGNVMFKENNEE